MINPNAVLRMLSTTFLRSISHVEIADVCDSKLGYSGSDTVVIVLVLSKQQDQINDIQSFSVIAGRGLSPVKKNGDLIFSVRVEGKGRTEKFKT